ncbi:uncharacterized protein LOC114351220 isoform X1 [Ostrinia furnacalis]|uniref:uncharacterized protein LOC114351220 isoform X1 n=1 Tax=Ostrinia furnacalis TaxID=93504 RepID=UPI00103EF557|nr:uncharacterized protein LOC114351220 isoform X1 [Ostrinia furnacalis]
MSMSRKKCCVPGCSFDSESSHRTLHLFPNPAKDRDRFNQWVFSIGGDIIGLDNEDIYKHRSVCHSHFEQKFCCRFNRLSKLAMPTLNMPGHTTIPKFSFVERRPMRQLQNLPTNTTSAISMPATVTSPIPSTSASLAGLQMHSPETAVEVITSVDTNEIKNVSTLKENIDPVVTQPAVPARKNAAEFNKEFHRKHSSVGIKRHIIATPEEKKLHQKLLKIRIKLSKCRNKMKKQAASLQAAKKITSNPALLSAMEKLPSTSKLLTLLQFRESKKLREQK